MIKVIQGKRFEDYLKVIFKIKVERGEVRLKDIVKELNVKPSTALQYILKLRDMGLVTYYQGRVDLTPRGEKQAKELFNKFVVISKFFKEVIGLSDEKANEISCLIEHILDEKSLERMEYIMEAWKSKCSHLDSFEATNKQ